MTDRLAEIKNRHETFTAAVRENCPELLTNSLTEDVAWLIAEVERLRTERDRAYHARDTWRWAYAKVTGETDSVATIADAAVDAARNK